MLVRHGTRYPKAKHLTEFMQLKKLQTEIVTNHENKGNEYTFIIVSKYEICLFYNTKKIKLYSWITSLFNYSLYHLFKLK
jgi:PIN domain nuclease of toxin-antitoxin system